MMITLCRAATGFGLMVADNSTSNAQVHNGRADKSNTIKSCIRRPITDDIEQYMASRNDCSYAVSFQVDPDVRSHVVDCMSPGSSRDYVINNKIINPIDTKVKE